MNSRKRRSDRSGRPPLPSPGRPSVAGMESEEAAGEDGVSPPVGTRWFRAAGGMPPVIFRLSARPLSGRYRACTINCVTGYHASSREEGGIDDQARHENECVVG